nr:cytochrome C-type biogenesis protein CcmE isoform X1 [Ipomoea batatas]
MASRLISRFASTLTRSASTTNAAVIHHFTATATATATAASSLTKSHPLISLLQFQSHPFISPSRLLPYSTLTLRSFSTVTRPSRPHRPARPDIGARARQMQNRRLWTYALTFSCVAGFIIIVLNQFQDQLVFYVTPSDAISKYTENPTKAKFRLGGLVLEGSVAQMASSPEMEFVITDLITDILVKFEGSLPDLFREGHSVVVEGFIKPFTEDMKKTNEVILKENKFRITEKARSGVCYFEATEVLAKHDEKYMPQEVAAALEKNKKLLEQQKIEESGTETAIAKP